MKEKKTVMQKLIGKERIDSVGLFIQFVLMIAIVILAICTLFVYELNYSLQGLVVLLLFVMGYNNHTVFHRKGFTPLYIVVGIALFVAATYGYIYA